MEGANAGYFSADGTRFWQADRRPGQDTFTAHWHQDDPGVLPAGDNTGAGAPAGVVRYESDALGSRYRGHAAERRCRAQRGLRLSAEAARRRLRARALRLPLEPGRAERELHLEPGRSAIGASGSGRATSPSAPTARSTSPTGSIRSSAAIRCTTRKGYGRIYRITPKGRQADDAGDRSDDDRGADSGAAQPGGQRSRRAGSSGLKAGGAAALPAVEKRARGRQSVPSRAGDLAARRARARRACAKSSVSSPMPIRRSASPRSARCAGQAVGPRARRAASPRDPSPAVRREVALALRGVPFDQSRDILAGARRRLRRHGSLVSRGARHGGDGQRGARSTRRCCRPCPSAIRSSGTRASPRSPGGCIRWRRSTPSPRAPRHRSSPAEARQQALVALGFINDPTRRAGDGRSDAQPASRRGGAGRVVDDLSQDERLASLSGRRLDRRPRPDAKPSTPSRDARRTGRWCWTTARRSIGGSRRRWRWRQIRPARSSSSSSPPRTRSPISCARRSARSSSAIPIAACDRLPPASSRGRAAGRA